MDGEELGTAVVDAMLAGIWNMLQALPGIIVRTFELHRGCGWSW